MSDALANALEQMTAAYKEVGVKVGEVSTTLAENTRICRESVSNCYQEVSSIKSDVVGLSERVDALSEAIAKDTASREKLEAEKRNDAKAAAAWLADKFQKYWLPFLLTAGAGGASLGGWHISKAPEPTGTEAPAAAEETPAIAPEEATP